MILLKITPTEFRAANDKLNTDVRYLRRSLNPTFRFVFGRSMDVSGGGLRYIDSFGNAIDDNTYNGTFYQNPSIGVSI